MPGPVDTDWINGGLEFAATLGVISSFTLTRRGSSYRHWTITFPDGDVIRWTAGAAEAFVIGVRATHERLEGTVA